MPRYTHYIWEDEYHEDDNIKCKNFDIWCKAKFNECHASSRAGIKGLCINCDIKFGKELEKVENVECPVCLETGPGIRQLNCIHSACIDCFLKMNIGMWDLDTRPVEPAYETVLDEDGIEIVKLPNPEWERWNEEEALWEQRGYKTSSCPLCRA